jgi:hypothetical protein
VEKDGQVQKFPAATRSNPCDQIPNWKAEDADTERVSQSLTDERIVVHYVLFLASNTHSTSRMQHLIVALSQAPRPKRFHRVHRTPWSRITMVRVTKSQPLLLLHLKTKFQVTPVPQWCRMVSWSNRMRRWLKCMFMRRRYGVHHLPIRRHHLLIHHKLQISVTKASIVNRRQQKVF